MGLRPPRSGGGAFALFVLVGLAEALGRGHVLRIDHGLPTCPDNVMLRQPALTTGDPFQVVVMSTIRPISAADLM